MTVKFWANHKRSIFRPITCRDKNRTKSNFRKASSIEFQTGEMITVQYQCSLENNILKMDFGIHGNTPTIPSGTVLSFHKIF